MVLVWQITDYSPNSPNFLPPKLSRYKVYQSPYLQNWLIFAISRQKNQIQLVRSKEVFVATALKCGLKEPLIYIEYNVKFVYELAYKSCSLISNIQYGIPRCMKSLLKPWRHPVGNGYLTTSMLILWIYN